MFKRTENGVTTTTYLKITCADRKNAQGSLAHTAIKSLTNPTAEDTLRYAIDACGATVTFTPA
jgi:hypothetical protein